MQSGYVAPSRIAICSSWDLYASGSFTYWEPLQENMELGIVSDNTNPPFSVNPFGINGYVVNTNFNYKPGFKLAVGMNFDHDNWDSSVQYTWFRGTYNTSVSLDSAANPDVTLFPMWAIAHLNSAAYISFYDASQKWTLHMDLLDWELARSCYLGSQLSFRPFFALRGAWIRQSLNMGYFNELLNIAPFDNISVTLSATSHSWAVGPRVGCYSNWMIGKGFRIYGNAAGDLLFTQYTKLRSHIQSMTAEGTVIAGQEKWVQQTDLDYLRAHLDLALGLGWGSYFYQNKWHVDLSADYGFQAFFSQNMFRRFDNGYALAHSTNPNGDLYIQGLTATARFDF